MTNQSYSTAQKLAFAGLTIGFLLCAAGFIAPYWQEGSISTSKILDILGKGSSFLLGEFNVPNVELVKLHGGLWWFCTDAVLLDNQCEVYSFKDNEGAFWAIRIGAAVNVVLGLLCTLVALCRSCCCQGGKTVCHGVMAFFAGAAGLTAVGLYASSAREGFVMTLQLVEFGWAFYIYAVGSGMIAAVSFVLCFASPMNPITGVIVNTVNQAMTNGYTRMATEHPMVEQQQPQVVFSPNTAGYAY